MSARKRKPAAMRDECDRLFSKLVRVRAGRCENCGNADPSALTCAHIITRKYSATRCDFDNAFCLCWQCHRRFTDFHGEWMDFVDRTIGRPEYDRLARKAEVGISLSSYLFWLGEVERLRALTKEAA